MNPENRPHPQPRGSAMVLRHQCKARKEKCTTIGDGVVNLRFSQTKHASPDEENVPPADSAT